jgi:hypothetical protein
MDQNNGEGYDVTHLLKDFVESIKTESAPLPRAQIS